MAALAESLTAVEDRPLRLRRRADLEIQQSSFQGETSWIVKDPVSLKYHRLREPELIVLNMIDGRSTLSDIKDALQRKYPTKITRLADLQMLLSSLHRAGMLLADMPGQGAQLLKRHREKQRKEWTGRLSNILSIRFPGVDPERLLSWLHPKLGWIFGPAAVFAWALLALTAGWLVASDYGEFQRRLPAFYQFFNVQNFFWLALVLAVTKITHEIGHGLSCKHFGGECHEIGMMLLVLTPALYCDTSDSWLLRSKWHRAFIGAAGMYVEVFMASLATFVWWYTQPGLVHYMALNVMFICSVSTIVFNANPLLRYDGYYILSDLLKIPNLSQKSRLSLLNTLRVWCLGMQPVSPRSLPQRGHLFFALYSVASFCYRWFVLIMIVWFLSHLFEPYGLQVIGYLIIGMSCVGLIVIPMWRLGTFFATPGRLEQVKRGRAVVSGIVFAVIIAALALVPLPHRVTSSLVVRPDGAQRVYVSVPGALRQRHVKPGDEVAAGSVLAELDSPETALSIARVEGQLKQQQIHVQSLARRQSVAAAASAIPAARAALDDLSQRLQQLRTDQQRLTLTADIDGTVIPPPENAASHTGSDGPLPTWSGTPLDPQNNGAYLETGTLFCLVGDPRHMKAILLIVESDTKLVEAGQQVEMVLDEIPGRRLRGTIREIAKIDLQIPPRELTAEAGGSLATQPDAAGQPRPLFAIYEATVPLHELPSTVLSGFRGRAKISVAPESLGRRLVRFIRHAIHFR